MIEAGALVAQEQHEAEQSMSEPSSMVALRPLPRRPEARKHPKDDIGGDCSGFGGMNSDW
jgi:hypothetical protein